MWQFETQIFSPVLIHKTLLWGRGLRFYPICASLKGMHKYILHIEDAKESEPRPHERRVAEIIAELFESDIVFIRRSESRTPDLYVLKTNTRWELKSPKGGSKHTIQNNLREAEGQSSNVILDLTRAKLTNEQDISRAREFIKKEKTRIKRLKVLTKELTIIDIK